MPATNESMSLSIRPHEIVPATRAITVSTTDDLDTSAMRGGIAVQGVPGRIEANGKALTFTPTTSLPPGRQTLVVDELVGAGGRRLAPGGRLEFTVVDTPADPGPEVAIESLTRLVLTDEGTRRLPLDRAPEGRFVDVVKGERRNSGEPFSMAVDQDGRNVDVDDHLRAVAKRQSERFGKIHPDLGRAMAGDPGDRDGDEREGRGNDRLHVAVWMRQPDAEEFRAGQDRLRHELDDQAQRRAGRDLDDADLRRRETPREVGRLRESIVAARARGVEVVREVAGDQVRPDRHAPVVYAWLSDESVRALAERDDVAGLFLYDPDGVDDLDNSIDVANSDAVHASGVGGQGVRVAVFEQGPDVLTNLDVEDRFDATPSTSSHSRHVHGIIKNVQRNAPHGHAPDCLLYSANDYDLDALAWAVEDADCTIVNQSFHRTAETTSSGLSFDDIYKDWLTLSYPWPLVVQAAGNTGESGATINPASDEYVNHKTYNHLTVGNHNDDASSMSSTTIFRNPASSHGDRELPEIAANGTSVTAVGLTLGGTSMASPAVAGVAALAQSTHPSLQIWPEGTRAVLLAGATRNVRDGTWWADVVADRDTFDGSGAVNGQESHLIAQSRRFRNASATRRGWDAGTLRGGDLDGSGLTTFRYRVTVPSSRIPILGPRHVKVALAWDSDVREFPLFDLPISSVLDVDLDLKVFDANGTQVGYSGSWDNSYEIAEFTGKPGQTYDIHVRRWSGDRDVWYGIAWTVTGGLLLRFPTDITVGTVFEPIG